MQTGLKISWFINLIFLTILLGALIISYGFKVPRSRPIAAIVILVCNILSMLSLSAMGLILAIQRYYVGWLSTAINAYGTNNNTNASCVFRGGRREELSCQLSGDVRTADGRLRYPHSSSGTVNLYLCHP